MLLPAEQNLLSISKPHAIGLKVPLEKTALVSANAFAQSKLNLKGRAG